MSTKSVFSIVFLLQAVTLLASIGVKAQSPTPSCYICPTEDGNARPLATESYGSDDFLCNYSGGGSCIYSAEDGQFISAIGNDACFGVADNVCRIRNRMMRERALPRSPRAPSPGAFAEKPQVMHTRAELGKSKKASRDL
ncbi:hypothetical protein BKA70DRAFT_1268947 [Coprinopsis sp. MPI-PUGE-AT-0042]|nr:hypothetical protein BKA70DRAFT_1268947 [Coprinopsis sp. MPI-PUGE-AT-0042]